LAAGCVAFIGGEKRIGGGDLERGKGNVEFFGGDLLLKPWPSSALPVNTAMLPSASMRTQESRNGVSFRLPGSGGGGATALAGGGSSAKAFDDEKLTIKAPPPAMT